MKAFKIVTILVLLTSINQHANDRPAITLQDPVLEFIDGTSFMNGEKFGNTMKLRRELLLRRFEKKTNQGAVRFYTFMNKKYSLSELAALEKKLSGSSAADKETLASLEEYLPEIKNEFIALSQPFLAQAQGAKDHMLKLITEWAHKARIKSHLLSWGASKEGQESIIVQSHIKNYEELDQFFDDLVYFLESLLRSCPIAEKQFKDFLEQKQKEHAAQGAK